MKKATQILCILFAVIFLTSCYSTRPLIGTIESGSRYNVDFLFEHDGCKVYRFYDMGNYVYFTNCMGDITAIKNDSTNERVENQVRITYDSFKEE